MAFTEYRFGPHRWEHFSFFAAGSAVNSYIAETVDLGGKPWRLAELRINFSTAFGSVNYLRALISAALGSSYDATLLSQDLNGVKTLLLQYSDPILMMSGDKLYIISSQISVANEYGVQVIGWAVAD